MTIKDAADLFAARGEEARDVIENLKNEAKDALSLAISEAPPKGDTLGQYRYFKDEELPLLMRLEDPEERRAALHDIAREQDLRVRNLQRALTAVEQQAAEEGVAERSHDDDPAVEETGIPEPGTERYERAMGLLTSPHFLGLFVRYTGALGHVGDYVAKLLALLCALSALMGRPIQPSTHAQSSAGKNALWDSAISFLPPEMVVNRTGLSAKALFRTDMVLAHKVLYIAEIVGSEEADYTIRTLQSDGRLVYEATEKMPDGTMRNVVHEVEGPTVVIQTTTRNHLHPENETRVFPIFVDESNRQTRRILDSYLRDAEEGGADPQERERILERFRDAFRLLEPGEVVIPYAQRIRIPDSPVRVRRDARRLLDLIRVITWAHQHQRDRDESGRIIATEDDFRKALGLATKSLASAWKSLAPVEEDVLRAIEKLPPAKRRNGFGRADLDVEGRDDRRVQDALKSLASTGYLDCDGRRGPQGYRYTLVRESGERRLGISLRSADGEAAAEADSDNEDEEDDEGERASRESARNGIRAIESGPLQEEDVIARSREDDTEDHFEDDESEDEEVVDHRAELTDLSWYRAQITFAEEDAPEDQYEDEDLVSRTLRHEVGIYRGPNYTWKSPFYEFETPWVGSTVELFKLRTEESTFYREAETEEDLLSAGWPTSPEEMATRLERVIPRLQAKARRFWDPGFSDWYAAMAMDHPRDLEKVCKPAYLHPERWMNEHSGEELWALVALQEGWRVPDEAIEEAVWRRVTAGPRTTEEIGAKESTEEDAEFEL